MSVLVRGMKMPRTCAICEWSILSYPNAWCGLAKKKTNLEIARTQRAAFCPLVEVPTPHGRLIDADAFDERVRVAGGMSEEELTEDFKDGVQTVLYMLSKQPTIIEAEGSDT